VVPADFSASPDRGFEKKINLDDNAANPMMLDIADDVTTGHSGRTQTVRYTAIYGGRWANLLESGKDSGYHRNARECAPVSAPGR
jgi:hypothetical protein